MPELDHRIALITGGSRGIGRSTALAFAAATALLLAGPNGGFYVGACLSPNGGDVTH